MIFQLFTFGWFAIGITVIAWVTSIDLIQEHIKERNFELSKLYTPDELRIVNAIFVVLCVVCWPAFVYAYFKPQFPGDS